MMVWPLFIIDLMGLFFYTKIGSIRSIGDLPTTNIIEPFNYQNYISNAEIPAKYENYVKEIARQFYNDNKKNNII